MGLVCLVLGSDSPGGSSGSLDSVRIWRVVWDESAAGVAVPVDRGDHVGLGQAPVVEHNQAQTIVEGF